LGISGYFKKIFGQPPGKLKNLQAIATWEKAAPAAMVFIGDNQWDYEAAEKFGCQFIGVANPKNNWANAPFPIIKSLTEISGLIN